MKMRNFSEEVNFAGLKHLVPFKEGKILTNSARSVFLNCRKKYEFNYIYGLTTRKVNVPFLVGGLYHNELEEMYSTGSFDPKAANERVSKACDIACQSVGITGAESDLIWSQQAIVMGMSIGYAKLYLKNDLKKWKVIEPESSFTVDIGTWKYRGKVDLIVQDKKTKVIKLIEHKTTGQLTPGYIAKLPLDNQILGYAWAKIQQGFNVTEIVYNICKKPVIKQRQNETVKDFFKRLEAEYINEPVKYFYRETIKFSKDNIKRFEDELKYFIGEIDDNFKRGRFYQNTTHCTAYGNCEYMKLCIEGVNKENLLMYRIKKKLHEELDDE